MDKKYVLSAPTKEEQDNFLKEFQALCDKHSIYFEPIPQFTRKTIQDPWTIVCQAWIQKKTEEITIKPEDLK